MSSNVYPFPPNILALTIHIPFFQYLSFHQPLFRCHALVIQMYVIHVYTKCNAVTTVAVYCLKHYCNISPSWNCLWPQSNPDHVPLAELSVEGSVYIHTIKLWYLQHWYLPYYGYIKVSSQYQQHFLYVFQCQYHGYFRVFSWPYKIRNGLKMCVDISIYLFKIGRRKILVQVL
jgi:hypothetical protein